MDNINFNLKGINGKSAVHAVNNALRRIDPRLVDHGDRVAFIACQLMEEGALPLNEEKLFMLSVFHDIGAYKTDEIDRMLEFETKDVTRHSLYGHLFIKYLTPLGEASEAILHHHDTWQTIVRSGSKYGEYATLIHLADRIDIISVHFENLNELESLFANKNEKFRPEYIELFKKCYKKRKIFERLSDGSYIKDNEKRLNHLNISTEDTLGYLKVLVYSIDFRSENTVTHTINTVSIAVNIARHFSLSDNDVSKIYYGSLLHDTGKITIPLEILEFPGRLTVEQMSVMRTHVDETENIISGVVPDDIMQIAVRHHEKLDGSGYPKGLTAKEITFSQRIVAVADIVSALGSRRSYKEPFPKEKTLSIISEMADRGQLDKDICSYICNNYDSIMHETDANRNVVIQKYSSIMSEFNQLMKERELAVHGA